MDFPGLMCQKTTLFMKRSRWNTDEPSAWLYFIKHWHLVAEGCKCTKTQTSAFLSHWNADKFRLKRLSAHAHHVDVRHQESVIFWIHLHFRTCILFFFYNILNPQGSSLVPYCHLVARWSITRSWMLMESNISDVWWSLGFCWIRCVF